MSEISDLLGRELTQRKPWQLWQRSFEVICALLAFQRRCWSLKAGSQAARQAKGQDAGDGIDPSLERVAFKSGCHAVLGCLILAALSTC